ncbi:MAG: sigma-70 family RNA polymerase sigma factor [Acidobacteriota bacterium]
MSPANMTCSVSFGAVPGPISSASGAAPERAIDEFEAAALPHLNELYRTARHVIGNSTEAEDLVQETYLQAWKSFHRFEAGTNCRAWLHKILFHMIQHHRRKTSRFKWFWESEELLEESLQYTAPVSDQLTDEDILAALHRMPAKYREVLLLADVQEFSYREVSAMLKVPMGTVMSRLSRGRSLLKQELAAKPLSDSRTGGAGRSDSARSQVEG